MVGVGRRPRRCGRERRSEGRGENGAARGVPAERDGTLLHRCATINALFRFVRREARREMKETGSGEVAELGERASAARDAVDADAPKRVAMMDAAAYRGLDMAAARKMLYEAGFTALRLGNGKTISLDLGYQTAHGPGQRSRGSRGEGERRRHAEHSRGGLRGACSVRCE